MSTAAISALCAGIAAICTKIWSRKVKIEDQPVSVDGKVESKKAPNYVTIGECNRRMCEMKADVDGLRKEITSGNKEILRAIDANDTKSEERAVALNRRIDPMIGKLHECIGQVDLIKSQVKDAWKSATVGGGK